MSSENNLFTQEHEITYAYRDINDNPFPDHIMQIVQDISEDHSASMGLGYKNLKEKNQTWILVKTRIVFLAPVPIEPLKVSVWPLKPTFLSCPREAQFVDKDGHLLIKSFSEWAVIDLNTRKLVRPNFTYADGYIKDKTNFPGSPLNLIKPLDLTGLKPVLIHQVQFTDLDHNRHANNTHYASLALDSIPDVSSLKLTDLQINYVKECHFGEKVSTLVKQQGELTYQVEGIKEDGSAAFNSILSFKHI
jgi:acyl-ACP thioesterase